MPIFLCRWPNGSFSVVGAANKGDAVMELDEIGDTDGAEISRMPSCLFDFEISPPAAGKEISFDGLIRFAGFGEQTRHYILEQAYPRLAEALTAALEAQETDPAHGDKIWAAAIEQELQRVKHEPVAADTEAGRFIQNQTGMSAEVANRIVRRGAQQILESLDPGSEPKQ